MIINRAMQKARRMARSVPRGDELLELVTSSHSRRKLISAAEGDFPPVSAISEDVIALLGGEAAQCLLVRQYVGLCVRGLLAEEGFELAKERVRIANDPVFKTGATYQRAPRAAAARGGPIERMLGALTEAEMRGALRFLKNRLGE